MPESVTPSCVARWASSSRYHRAGEVCGDQADKRLADVDLCMHHYLRAVDRALLIVKREQREAEADWYGSRTWEPDAAEVVYYLRRASDGLIKIGTSAGFRSRLSELRREHGQMEILLTHRGDRETEAAMHARFRRLRVEGEFFRPAPRLLRWIISVRERQRLGTALRGTVPLVTLRALAEGNRPAT